MKAETNSQECSAEEGERRADVHRVREDVEWEPRDSGRHQDPKVVAKVGAYTISSVSQPPAGMWREKWELTGDAERVNRGDDEDLASSDESPARSLDTGV